jgi:hypothetical protein
VTTDDGVLFAALASRPATAGALAPAAGMSVHRSRDPGIGFETARPVAK